jgi:uncharacterized membrane protein YsdA (DUF1294 family)
MPEGRYKRVTKSFWHAGRVAYATLAALWIGLLSIVTLVMTIADKARASWGARRVRERTLLGLALVGGSPGLLLGMLLTRHKTAKRSFRRAFALIVLAQLALVAWLVLR